MLHIRVIGLICVVQAGSGELSTSISEQLTSLKQRVYRYHNDNQDVNITRLTATISALQQTAHDLAERYIVVSVCGDDIKVKQPANLIPCPTAGCCHLVHLMAWWQRHCLSINQTYCHHQCTAADCTRPCWTVRCRLCVWWWYPSKATSKPHPVPHCRVLPPGAFNGMMPETLSVH